MKIKLISKISLLIFVITFSGCASLMGPTEEELEKEFAAVSQKEKPLEEDLGFNFSDEDMGLEEEKPEAEPKPTEVKNEENSENEIKYSDVNNFAPSTDRSYKRMTRKKMEEESELYSSAGSLWKMDGQTSYLFAENKMRQTGDPTVLKVEGSAVKLLENKVNVVQELLFELDQQRKKAEEEQRKENERKAILAQKKLEKKIRAERIARGEIVVDPLEEEMAQQRAEEDLLLEMRKPANYAENTEKLEEIKYEKFDLKEVENIPAKIVERLPDNFYRIKGQQFMTIKKKPYKVIATGLLRAEDFDDKQISSAKLIDAQYDIVHVKRDFK